jgi:hypothetical protein
VLYPQFEQWLMRARRGRKDGASCGLGLMLRLGHDATCLASRSQGSIFSLLSQRQSGGNESYSNNNNNDNNNAVHSSPRPNLPPQVPLAPWTRLRLYMPPECSQAIPMLAAVEEHIPCASVRRPCGMLIRARRCPGLRLHRVAPRTALHVEMPLGPVLAGKAVRRAGQSEE